MWAAAYTHVSMSGIGPTFPNPKRDETSCYQTCQVKLISTHLNRWSKASQSLCYVLYIVTPYQINFKRPPWPSG